VVLGAFVSVINQMLRDLDQRQPNQSATQAAQSVTASSRPVVYRRWGVLLLVLALMLWLLWALVRGYFFQSVAEPVAPEQTVSALNHALEADTPVAASVNAPVDETVPVEPLPVEQSSHNALEHEAVIATIAEQQSAPAQVDSYELDRIESASHERSERVESVVQHNEAQAEPVAQGQSSMRVDRIELTHQQQITRLKQQAHEAEQRGQTEQARQMWQQLMALEPGIEEPYLAMAEAAQRRANEAGVQYWLQLALEQGVESAVIHEQLAASFARQQLWPQALQHLGQIADTAMSIDSQALQATAWQQLGQHQQALSSFQRLAQQQPLQARWWLGMALSHDALGHSEQALDLFSRSLQLGSNLNPATVSYIQQRIQDLN
jgi:MSHA biogenesis protein MshN